MKRINLSILLVLLLSFNVFSQTLFDTGVKQYNAKEYEKAIATFKQVIAQNPNEYAAYYNMGLSFYYLKRFEEAISSFEKAIQIKADYTRAYIFLGNALDSINRYEDAISAYRSAILIEPNNATAYYEMGIAHKFKKNYQEAEKAFRKAVQLNPQNDNAKIQLGNVYVNLSLFPDAISIFNEVIAVQPTNADAYLGLGNAYYNNKKYLESIPFYKKATELSPNWQTAQLYLGDAYLYSSQFAQAVFPLKKAISLDPNLVEAYYGLGLTYYYLKNDDLAQEQLQKLKSLNEKRANDLAAKIGNTSPIVKPTSTPAPTKPVVKSAQRIKDEQEVANMADFGFDGAVVTQVSIIREIPQNAGKSVLSVKRGDILSLVSREPSNDWYQVVDEKTGVEGWINGNTIVVKLTSNKFTAPPLNETGATSVDAEPVVVISNLETKTTLNLRINGTLYKIPPQSSKTITVPAGKMSYYGWSPGIRPAVGNSMLAKGKKYSWEFKINRR